MVATAPRLRCLPHQIKGKGKGKRKKKKKTGTLNLTMVPGSVVVQQELRSRSLELYSNSRPSWATTTTATSIGVTTTTTTMMIMTTVAAKPRLAGIPGALPAGRRASFRPQAAPAIALEVVRMGRPAVTGATPAAPALATAPAPVRPVAGLRGHRAPAMALPFESYRWLPPVPPKRRNPRRARKQALPPATATSPQGSDNPYTGSL